MWPDRVSNLGPLTYESGALPTALRGPAVIFILFVNHVTSLETLCDVYANMKGWSFKICDDWSK